MRSCRHKPVESGSMTSLAIRFIQSLVRWHMARCRCAIVMMHGDRVASTHCLSVLTSHTTTEFTEIVLWQHIVIAFRGAIVSLGHKVLLFTRFFKRSSFIYLSHCSFDCLTNTNQDSIVLCWRKAIQRLRWIVSGLILADVRFSICAMAQMHPYNRESFSCSSIQ